MKSFSKDLVNALQVHANVLPYPNVEAHYKFSRQEAEKPPKTRAKLIYDYYEKLTKIYYRPEYEDMHVAYFYIESMTNMRPWRMFNRDKLPVKKDDYFVGSQFIDQELTAALMKYPDHPGLAHLCIHFHEMGAEPERALPACYSLVKMLEGENGHLMHMPSHIFLQTGDWGMAASCNAHSVRFNEKYESMIVKRHPHTVILLTT